VGSSANVKSARKKISAKAKKAKSLVQIRIKALNVKEECPTKAGRFI
jgi:hypothetical protein